MQLQYSRAFGGAGLKPYGLSHAADVRQVVLDASHKVLILASDGLWDVCNDQTAVAVAIEAAWQGRDASRALVAYALSEHQQRGKKADNVTVNVAFFTNTLSAEEPAAADVVVGNENENEHLSAGSAGASGAASTRVG